MTGELSVVVRAGVDVVRDHLRDLRNLPGLHPLVVAVDPGPVTDGHQAYTVTDRIALGGGLRVTSRYSVVIGPAEDGGLTAEARSVPRVRVSTRYRFTPVDGGTQVTETVSITAPRGLRRWVFRQAVQAHRAMLDRLPAHLEGAA